MANLPQLDPPHIKELISDLKTRLDNDTVKIYTTFDCADPHNYIRVDGLLYSNGRPPYYLKLVPNPNIANKDAKWDVSLYVFDRETSEFDWEDSIFHVALTNLVDATTDLIDSIRKNYD